MPPRAMELPVKIPGVVQGAKQVRDLAAAYKGLADVTRTVKFPGPSSSVLTRVDQLTQKLEKLAKAYESVGAAGGGMSFGGGGGGGSRGGGSRGGGRSSYLSGPNQKLDQIAQQRIRASAEGNQTVLRDLDILQFRAQRAKVLGERRLSQGDKALNGPGLLDLFGDLNGLMGSIRSGNLLGAGLRGISLLRGAEGGLNIQQKTGFAGFGKVPIAGIGQAGGSAWWQNALSAQGASTAAGAGASMPAWVAGAARLAGPLAAAAAGAVLFARATNAAGKNLSERFGASTISGGTPGSIAALGGLGVEAGAVGGAAGALRGRLSSDPLALLAAGRLGIGARLDPRIGGNQDLTKDLIAALKGLRGLREDDRLLQARRLGLEEFLPRVSVSPRVQQLQDRLEQASQRSRRTLQLANDFAESRRLAKESAQELSNAFGELGLPTGEAFERAKARANIALTAGVRSRWTGFDVPRPLGKSLAAMWRGAIGAKSPPMLKVPQTRGGTKSGESFDPTLGMMLDSNLDITGARAQSAIPGGLDSNLRFFQGRDAIGLKYRNLEAELLQYGSLGAFGL